jgi:hypothetical protein
MFVSALVSRPSESSGMPTNAVPSWLVEPAERPTTHEGAVRISTGTLFTIGIGLVALAVFFSRQPWAGAAILAGLIFLIAAVVMRPREGELASSLNTPRSATTGVTASVRRLMRRARSFRSSS